MATILYTSPWTDFSGDENIPIVINHNLNKCPKTLALQCSTDNGTTIGLPNLLDGNGVPLPAPYIACCTDKNMCEVYKPNAFTYTGKFRVVIYA